MDKLNDLKNDFLNEFSKIQDLEGPSYLYDPIKYFVKSPGKRLRPIIVLFLGELFKNSKEDSRNGAPFLESSLEFLKSSPRNNTMIGLKRFPGDFTKYFMGS